jgi:hypothetical protein
MYVAARRFRSSTLAGGWPQIQISDPSDFGWLLRAHRERPECGRRAAHYRDKVAPPHLSPFSFARAGTQLR